jgi:hypothetical protein
MKQTATSGQAAREAGGRRPWQPMSVTYIGHVGTILRQGGGKNTLSTADPGEPRKVRVQG